MLRSVSLISIGSVSTKSWFEKGAMTEMFSSRVVSVVSDSDGALGFIAMLYLEWDGKLVVHLGLTVNDERETRKGMQSALSARSLLMLTASLSRLNYYATSCAASSAGTGNASDYFSDCFPQYSWEVRKEYHMRTASWVWERSLHEFRCSMYANFDPSTFAIPRSSATDDSGTTQLIKKDGHW